MQNQRRRARYFTLGNFFLFRSAGTLLKVAVKRAFQGN